MGLQSARTSTVRIALSAALAAGVLAGSLLLAPPAFGALVWRGNFETGDLSQWSRLNAPPDGVKLIGDPVAYGRHGARISTVPGRCVRIDLESDGTCKRYHSYLVKNTYESPGAESWWKWNVLWPSGFAADTSVFNIYGEWHGWTEGLSGCGPNVSLSINRRSSGPNYPLSVSARGGECGAGPTNSASAGRISPGRWMELVWHVKWSQGDDGLVELWLDGVRTASVRGPNVFTGLPSGLYDVFLQMGIYSGASDRGQTIFVDDVIRGRSYADVAGAPPAPEPAPEFDPEPSGAPDPSAPEPSAPEPSAPETSGPNPSGAGGGSSRGRALDWARIDSFTYVTDDACAACVARMSRGELLATVASADERRDSAYGLRRLPGRWTGRLWTRTAVALRSRETLAGSLVLLQVRDADNELVYQVVAAAGDHEITVVSPPGGLDADGFRLGTGVHLRDVSRRVEVAAKPNGSIQVKVNGRTTNTLNALSGGTTDGQKYLRAGIVNYSGDAERGPAVVHRAVGASSAGWLGRRTKSLSFAHRPKSLTHGRLVTRLKGIPSSRVRVVVRGAGGRWLGQSRGRLGRVGAGRASVRLRNVRDVRRLRVRVRAVHGRGHARIVKWDQRRFWLTAAERRRLGRG